MSDPAVYTKEHQDSSNCSQIGESVQDTLTRLGVQVQQLCTVVISLKARSDSQTESRVAHLPAALTQMSRQCREEGMETVGMRSEEHDEMLTPAARKIRGWSETGPLGRVGNYLPVVKDVQQFPPP